MYIGKIFTDYGCLCCALICRVGRILVLIERVVMVEWINGR